MVSCRKSSSDAFRRYSYAPPVGHAPDGWPRNDKPYSSRAQSPTADGCAQFVLEPLDEVMTELTGKYQEYLPTALNDDRGQDLRGRAATRPDWRRIDCTPPTPREHPVAGAGRDHIRRHVPLFAYLPHLISSYSASCGHRNEGQSVLAACAKCTYGLGQSGPLQIQDGEGIICLVVKRHSIRPSDEQGLAGRNPPLPVLPRGDGGGIRAREQQLVRGLVVQVPGLSGWYVVVSWRHYHRPGHA